MRRSSLLLVVLVGTLVFGAIAPLTGAMAAENESTGSQGYTVQELSRGGTQSANSPDSLRMADQTAFWLIHWPANQPMANPGEDRNWKFLKRGETIERNSIYLRTFRFEGSETITVKKVYWQVGERRTGNNATKRVPVNVTVDRQKVEIPAGRPTKKINIRRHDKKVRVTMWIEEYPSARWTYAHRSVATTRPVNIQTYGDLLRWNLTTTYIPIIVGTLIAMGLVAMLLREAKAGPQYGYAIWIIVLGMGSAMAFFASYTFLADLFVALPVSGAFFVVGIVSIFALEGFGETPRKGVFFKPNLEAAVTPAAEQAHDLLKGEMSDYRLVSTGTDEGVAVVTQGVRPFLSRAFGGRAELENAKDIKTKIPLTGNTGDELYLVHPDSDELLEYEPEGWTFELPELDKQQLIGFGVKMCLAAAATLLAYYVADPGIATVTAIVSAGVVLLRPEHGHARVNPAPAHMRSVFAMLIMLREGTTDAETFDEMQAAMTEAEIQPFKKAMELTKNHGEIVDEEMFDVFGEYSKNASNGTGDDEKINVQETGGAANDG